MDKLEATEVRAKVFEEFRKVGKVREGKFKEDLQALKNITQELEAWVVRNTDIITKRWAQVAKLEAKLANTESKVVVLDAQLQASKSKVMATKAKAQAIEKWANSIGAWVVRKFRGSKVLEDEIAVGYRMPSNGFTECKDKVAYAFLGIDLSSIVDL